MVSVIGAIVRMVGRMIRICVSDDFTVDYDEERAMYRVGVLDEDAKIVNEYCFDAYKDEAVRHGKWIEVVVAETDTGRLIHWLCSECEIVVDHNTDNYCPNCGAKMDGE